jgi:hypothetical protein
MPQLGACVGEHARDRCRTLGGAGPELVVN